MYNDVTQADLRNCAGWGRKYEQNECDAFARRGENHLPREGICVRRKRPERSSRRRGHREPAEQIFKTLVARGEKQGYLVFCIPVCCELDLKKAAKAAKDKKVELIAVRELLPLTGYIRGGCSPIGMKKHFPTFIDETAILYDEIGVSAGQRGAQVLLNPDALCEYVGADSAT